MALFVSTLIELAQTSADQNGSMEEFQASLNAMMDRHVDVDPDTLVQTLIDNGAPAFEKETAESEAARQVIQNTTKEQVGKAILDFRNVKDYVFPDGYGRCFRSAVFTGESDQAKNEEATYAFLRKVNHPDPAIKHEAFLELMDRFSTANPREWMNYSDQKFAQNAGQLLPMLNMAFEAQNMYNYFKSAGVPITPEEEKRWDALTGKIGEVTPFVYSRLNMLCSPYYPKIDYKKLPLDNPEFWENAENLVDGEASSFLNDVTQYYNSTHSLSIQNAIINVLGRENLQNNLNGFSINSAPTFDLTGPDGRKYSTLDYDKDGPAGKPLFVFIGKVKNQLVAEEKERLRAVAEQEHWSDEKLQKELNNEKGILKRVSEANPDKFFCVQDLAGNGVYTVVPPPVKKPGRLSRFFHNVSKFFGGKGRDDCNNYDRYTDEISEMRKQAEKKTPFDEFKKAANEQQITHKDVLSAEYAIPIHRKSWIEADRRFTEFLGTEPKENDYLIHRGCYKKGELDLTKYELPEGFTDEEFATAAFAALADTELAKDLSHRLDGLSDVERAKMNYTNLTEDLLYKSDGSTRLDSGRWLPGYRDARKMAKESLDAFAAGNKEPLAKLLGNSIPRQIRDCTKGTEYSATQREGAKCLERELQLLSKHPELIKLSGLKPEEIRSAQAIVKMGELFENRQRAGEMLKKAADGEQILSPEERQRCLEDVLVFQAVEQMEARNRVYFEDNDPELNRIKEQITGLRDNQRLNLLLHQQTMQYGERPQSALLLSLSDPKNGPAAMEQLRERVRNSSAMQEMSAKNIVGQMTFAGAAHFNAYEKTLTQEVFPKQAAPKPEKEKARERSKSVSLPKNDGMKLG